MLQPVHPSELDVWIPGTALQRHQRGQRVSEPHERCKYFHDQGVVWYSESDGTGRCNSCGIVHIFVDSGTRVVHMTYALTSPPLCTVHT